MNRPAATLLLVWCPTCRKGEVTELDLPSPDQQCACGEVRDMMFINSAICGGIDYGTSKT